ncbi:MAG: hypothetical protein N2Z72_02380 [Bacteroidales bacterium]|nr:hypothetical protein [Bacteroidales bacterium]
MKKIILNLLELLRTGSPEESEINELLYRLKSFYPDFPLQECLQLSEQKKYDLIETHISSFFKSDVLSEDISSIEGLKTRLYFLEIQHSILSQKLNLLEQQLWHFKQRYYQELNDYISRLLDLKWEVLALKKEKDKSFFDDFVAIDEERKTFKEFSRDKFNHQVINLSNEEENQLQTLYRAASKLCHPDLVIDEFKQEAEKWFIELSHAYQAKDLKRIQWIYDQLNQREVFFPKITETLSSKELILASIRKLEKRNVEIEKQINEIQMSSLYRTIISNHNIDGYFDGLKKHFIMEIEILEKELIQLRS